MVKNRVRGLLGHYPELVRSQPYNDIFCREGVSWLKTIPVKSPNRDRLGEELALHQTLEERIRHSDGLVKELARRDERLQLLETIPGIGTFFAVLIAHEMDDISRFPSEKKFCSYVGIVPSTYSSAAGPTMAG